MSEGKDEATEASEQAPAQPEGAKPQPEGAKPQPEGAQPQPEGAQPQPATETTAAAAKPAADDSPAADSGADAGPLRRVRRTHKLDVPPEVVEAAVEADAAPAGADVDQGSARPERPTRGERPPRGPRAWTAPGERPARNREPRAPRGRDRSAAAMAGQRRKVYRQDAPQGAPPPPPKTEEQLKVDAKAEARRKAEEQSKITLLLHPAPKAVPSFGKKKKGPKTAKEALLAKAAKRGKGGAHSSKGASKAADKPAAEASEVTLEPAWLKAKADAAANVLEKAGSGGEALIRGWLDGNNAAAIAGAAAAESLQGRLRKAARRALNVLKARGVDIPTIETASASEPKKAEEPTASFVPPDNAGMVFFSISQRQTGGRYHVADVVVREPDGVLHASSGFIARKQIRQWHRRIEERYGTQPVQVPLEWARQRIAEARKLNDVSKQLVPLGFDGCAALLAPAPSEDVPHPLADLEAKVSDSDVDKAKGDSDTLHEQPEFQAWLPDRVAIDEMLAKVGERVGADGINDSDKVDEALKLEVSSATDRFFSPEKRGYIANQMRDSAISLRSRLGEDPARRVLAVARAVREAGLVTAPPSEVPFLRRYFQKAIAVLVHQGRGRLQVPIPRPPAPEPDQVSPT